MKAILAAFVLLFSNQVSAQEVDLNQCVGDKVAHPAQCMIKVAEIKMMMCKMGTEMSLREADTKLCSVEKESAVLKPFYQATVKKYKNNPAALRQAKVYYAKFNTYIAGLSPKSGDSEMSWGMRVTKAGSEIEEAGQMLLLEI